MSAKWQPKSKEVLLQWIAALSEPAVHETLTDWEQHFLASISFNISSFKPSVGLKYGVPIITERQQNILEGLYAEKTK